MFKDLASCVGTYFSVLSYGKFAKNEYLRSAIQNGIDVMSPEACTVVNISMYTTDVVVFVNRTTLSPWVTLVSFLD